MFLVSVTSYSTVGWRWVWYGDKLHYPGCRKHRLHGGAAGALRRHLSGWNLEHVHRHPAKKCSKPANKHWGGPHPAGAAQNELRGGHDCRYDNNVLPRSNGDTCMFAFRLILIMLMSSKCHSHWLLPLGFGFQSDNQTTSPYLLIDLKFELH